MTVRQAVLMIAGLLGVAVVLYPMFRYVPKRDALREIDQEIEARRAMLMQPATPAVDGELERLRAEQAELAKQLTDARADFASFKARLLPGPSAARTQFVLTTISQIADANGVQLQESASYDPDGEAEPLSPLAEVVLEDAASGGRLHRLSTESSFAGLRGLLTRLNESLPEVLVVHFAVEASMPSADSASRIAATLILAI